jgi:hypothetical protein
MANQNTNDRAEQIKPLSLESAIIDVAPRIPGSEAKPTPPQPTAIRPHPSGRITLRPPQ